MSEDYVIREYVEGDEKSIVELLDLVFGGWPNFDLPCAPLEHWRWKYLDNPLGKSIISVAEFKGNLVGVNHALPVTLLVRGERMNASYVSDTVVHPDHQGKGVYKKLVSLKDRIRKEAGEKFGYLVTSNPILINIYDERETHWKLPRDILNLVRIKDIDKQLNEMNIEHPTIVKYGYLFLKYLNDALHGFHVSRRGDDDIRIKEVCNFDERIDFFKQRVEALYDFMVERDSQYLSWRYLDTRAGGYTVLLAESDEQILGYTVYKVNCIRPGYPIGYIMDLLARPGRDDVVEALIAESLKAMDEEGVNLTNLLIPRGSPYMEPALRQGLIDSRADIHAYFRIITPNKNLDQLYNPKTRIHFTYGDLDTLPSRIPENINLW